MKALLGALRASHEQSLAAAITPGRRDERRNLAVAGALAALAALAFLLGGYHAGFAAIHDAGAGLPPALLATLTTLGDTLLALCLLAFLARRQPRLLWTGVVASVYATIVSHALKPLLHSARPPEFFREGLAVIGPAWHWGGFPSGHSLTAFVAASCFALGAGTARWLSLLALAALVGLSRVWVGVHWPLDVLGGAALGAGSMALAIRTAARWDWGLRFEVYTAIVAIIAGCCVAQLVKAPEYPLARPAAVVIAALALVMLARNFAAPGLARGTPPRP